MPHPFAFTSLKILKISIAVLGISLTTGNA